MSLSYGPLRRGAGEYNFSLEDAPKHLIYFTDFVPRLRATLDGETLLDTVRAKLLYETGIGPVAYIPLEDFDQARMERTEHSTHCPFKGDASYWSVGEHENVVWAYEQPLEAAPFLTGYAAVYFNRMDGWLVEDEPVFSALRDPFHRVDVVQSSRSRDGVRGRRGHRAVRRAAAAVRDGPAGAALSPARRAAADALGEGADHVPVQGHGHLLVAAGGRERGLELRAAAPRGGGDRRPGGLRPLAGERRDQCWVRAAGTSLTISNASSTADSANRRWTAAGPRTSSSR